MTNLYWLICKLIGITFFFSVLKIHTHMCVRACFVHW